MAEHQRPLRVITYLVPGLAVELFETLTQYLEVSLKRETMLIYESRYNGPPASRVDLFKTDLADLAFMTGASYERLVKEGNQDWELLPVGGVFPHFVRGETPGYFADIIIHKSSKERIKDFLDLRGSNWATNGPASTSGHFIVLKKLKERGENPSFFGSVLDSGSHMGSIQMVASKQADVAAVDSNVLAYAFSKNPALKEDVHVFESYGPLPSYPLVVRASLPAQEKQAICDALLQLNQISPWNLRAASLRLARFVKIDKDLFLNEYETRKSLANLSASVRYY